MEILLPLIIFLLPQLPQLYSFKIGNLEKNFDFMLEEYNNKKRYAKFF